MLFLLFLSTSAVGQGEPPLPRGLQEEEKEEKSGSSEPALPQGLGGDGGNGDSGGPALPEGLGGGDTQEKGAGGPSLPEGLGGESAEEQPSEEEAKSWRERLPFEVGGFLEGRAGLRTREDDYQNDSPLSEVRLQLEIDKYFEGAHGFLTTDFVHDTVQPSSEIDLETGRGWLDLREAGISTTPVSFMDVKVGRQILTWGTGDLVFLNDLFPKDWRSFFSGRDVEYLKAPSDAAKVSLFSDAANLDVVYTPGFDPDRFNDGERLSFWRDSLGRRAGEDAVIETERKSSWFDDDEIALRLHRMLGSYEVAAYFYDGYWKSPGGMDPMTGQAIFPELTVYGASVEGRLGTGIANSEIAYYDSDDPGGDDPFVNNDQLRFLVGYDQEVAALIPSVKDFTVGLQYYLEHKMDYDDYRETLPPAIEADEEGRHTLTLRLTKLYWNQNLELSLFTFYSPSDSDAYLRPRVTYDVTDNWKVVTGGNIFVGEHDYTFLNQFQNNSNVYAALRYSF